MTLQSLFTFSLIFFLCSSLSAQINQNQNTKTRGADFGRVTIRPAIYPYFELASGYTNNSGSTVITSEGRGVEGFLRFSRYRPGRNLSLGLDVGYSQQRNILRHQTDPRFQFASLTTGSVIVSPHISITARGVNKKNHPVFIVGASNRYQIDRTIRYNDFTSGVSRAVIENDLPFLKRNSLYWMLGIGNIKDRVSLSRAGNKPSELSLQVFIPLFNQADMVSTDSLLLASNQLGSAFRGLKNQSIHLGLIYSEQIDFRRNDYKLPNKELELLADNNTLRAVQPLFGGEQPHHAFEGILTFMLTQQNGVEQIDSNIVSGEIINLRPSLGWRAAYTLHFFPNRNRYFDDRANKAINGSSVLFGLFAGVGAAQQTYRFNSSQQYYNYLRTTLFAEAGTSIGGTRGVTGFAGGGIRFFENTQSIFGEFPPPKFLEIRAPYFFAGLQLFSRFVLRAETTPLEFLESVDFEVVQRVNLSLGVGF